jgi:hypothetical protein
MSIRPDMIGSHRSELVLEVILPRDRTKGEDPVSTEDLLSSELGNMVTEVVPLHLGIMGGHPVLVDGLINPVTYARSEEGLGGGEEGVGAGEHSGELA